MKAQIILVVVFVVAAAALYWLLAPSAPLPEPKNDTVVWLGDSIGEGYGATEGNSPPEHLANMLAKPVINESESGDTTADGISKIDAVLAHNPGVVIVQLGGNDALRKRPQPETEDNLRTMIERFEASGAVVVLVGVRSGPFGGVYNDMFAQLADEYELLYLEDALAGLFGRPEYMADPIHPNDAGSARLAERVYELIAPMFE